MNANAGNSSVAEQPANLLIHQLEPLPEDDCATVVEGLTRKQKQLSPKYFYDRTGSELFDRITRTASYYPTRTEQRILEDNSLAIAAVLKNCNVLIEPGSGNCEKALPLLEAGGIRHYVPIEISTDFLVSACSGLAEQRPGLTVQAVCADFTQPLALPETVPPTGRMVFFPGSTIGNFEPREAARLLGHFRQMVGPGGYLLIGTDLEKDLATLEAAYNDPEGLTAAFNLNVLKHLRQRIGCDYDAGAYRHRAFYNPLEHRIEMHLVSRYDTRIRLAKQIFELKAGETIHTESSYKYTCAGFRKLAEEQGFRYCEHWTDVRNWYAVHLFQVAD